MRHNFDSVDDINLLANFPEATLIACTEQKTKFHTSDRNVQVSLWKPCSYIHAVDKFFYFLL